MTISPPNYTQTPNCLFSHWIKVLKEVELKVLLIIMRKTFGWHKKRDRISLSQLSALTGCSETNVLKAVRNLIEKGLIRKEIRGKNGQQKTFYEMIVSDVSEENSNNSDPSQFRRGTPHKLSGTKETLSSLSSKENQEKEIIIASEAASAKKEKTPAAGNNNSSASTKKKSEKKIHPCLKDIDIPERTKQIITTKHTEEEAQYVLPLFTHQDSNYVNKGPKETAKIMQDALNHPESYKDTIDGLGQPKQTKAQQQAKEEEIKACAFKSLREKNKRLVEKFKNRETYNGWKCRIDEDWFELTRGRDRISINFGDKEFEKILNQVKKDLKIIEEK